MNVIQKYFRHRQNLIDQYVRGDMSKAEYLEANYNAVVALNLPPFRKIDSLDKGLYNYQYYNAMAKDARSVSGDYDDYELRRERLDVANEYYTEKDNATMAVLKLLEYKSVHAYFIRVRSKHLKGKLFEIVIEDYQMILHSRSPYILNRLREEGVFTEGARDSLIDGYINQKY